VDAQVRDKSSSFEEDGYFLLQFQNIHDDEHQSFFTDHIELDLGRLAKGIDCVNAPSQQL
jgi:hypothetical protein